MLRSIFRANIVMLMLLVSAGCEQQGAPQLSPAAQELIAAHTGGMISRESSIRVEFYRDIVDSTRLDEVLEESPFDFEPDISGYATWISPRILLFRPENRLPGGEDYRVEIDLPGLAPDLFAGDKLIFAFTTIRQSFELEISGLTYITADDLTRQRLGGELLTADVEDGNLVGKILRANQEGRELEITWKHSEDRRTHQFMINGIERGSEPSHIAISWDGDPVDVDQEGSRTIPVVPLSEFELIDARAVRGKADFIEVRFSDPLLTNQRLEGLITIAGMARPGFEIDQNVVRIFSSEALSGDIDITISSGVRNLMGYRFGKEMKRTVTFTEIKPQVRFIGKGTILPATLNNIVPIEAVNLNAVIVEAIKIYESNIPQFLQVNAIDGDREIKRVARPVWKKTIQLDQSPDKRNRWVRYGLDLTPLIEANPRGLFRLRVYFRPDQVNYKCDTLSAVTSFEPKDNWDAPNEYGYWDDYEDADFNWYEYYQQRFNPCHPAYYRAYYDHNIRVERNILISDIGLIAKQGSEKTLFVAAGNLGTAAPLTNARITVFNYQQQEIAGGVTGENGVLTVDIDQKPFLIIARFADQTGYLKLDEASAQPVGHFDVGGESVKGGIKGYFYGERGVWRPGDTMHITFVLHDPDDMLPADHPVIFELRNARGQLVTTIKRAGSLNGFYTLPLKTGPDDPTGNWQIRAVVGATVFEQNLRVETIMPNRLKIRLDFGPDDQDLKTGLIQGEVAASWLHGASAGDLDADIDLTIRSADTRFAGYPGYSFDDPARRFEPEQMTVFKGRLNEQGVAHFSKEISTRPDAPGRLQAVFQTRVFEKSGAFSTDRFEKTLHPYTRYIGVRVPGTTDENRLLVTDSTHRVDIVALSDGGDRINSAYVEATLYKIKWRWWWEKGEDAIADYIGTEHFQVIKSDTVKIVNGKTSWVFRVGYPEWGRYLVRVRDLEGGHSTGGVVYIDWPGWARKSGRDEPGGATVLSFTSGKTTYQVGEEIEIAIPTAVRGRGLISIESGSRILRSDWISGSAETARYRFRATPDMAPNIFVNITYIQPAGQSENDLPIRLYGILPLLIYDPATTLKPEIAVPDAFRPGERAVLKVSENSGRAMTYTLAVVDEGLLDLTRFRTPDPWSYFYGREALGVRTWDLYDQVVGAFGGRFERLLSIGGGEERQIETGRQAQRFPPVVMFLGPFFLDRNAQNEHPVDIPQYVGSVRIMVVAGQEKAYGFAEKAIPVKKPLMVLGTLPRVLGTDAEVQLPVTVFALDEQIRRVQVTLRVSGPVTVAGPAEKAVSFLQTGDQMVYFNLNTPDTAGIARIRIIAEAENERAQQEIEIAVRTTSRAVTEVQAAKLEPGKGWDGVLELPGREGTNSVWLEVSRIPPLDLSRRLRYLINYPHGCIEQTVSAAFPQLYLSRLVKLSDQERRRTDENIRTAVERLQRMQSGEGGFQYWPGARSSDEWSTNYAGHFLLEAEKAGFQVPRVLKDNWERFQRNRARSWTTGAERAGIIQAYRLYTLALAGKPEMGAMNRLREENGLGDVGKWNLAAAYQLSGFGDVAAEVVRDAGVSVNVYRELSVTYGSDVRDRAMILGALTILGDHERAGKLAEKLSEELCSSQWLSTQTTAHALIALAHFAGVAGPSQQIGLTLDWQQQGRETIRMDKPVHTGMLRLEKSPPRFALKNNSPVPLYSRFIIEGTPAAGAEKSAANGLALDVQYQNLDGTPVDPAAAEQGSDIAISVKVRNTGNTGSYRELALSHMMPAGWEIRNTRMEGAAVFRESPFAYRDYRDDRVYTYFDLDAKSEKQFFVFVNAAYAGKFYLPMIEVEAMYDATVFARQAGRRITISRE